MTQPKAPASSQRTAAIGDAIVLALAVALSFVWYLPRIGFYSDDWAFIGLYATSADQSVRGLFNASYSSHHAMRPVQLWLCAVLYKWFGLEPLGAHAFNGLLLILNPLLCYAIARELRVRRLVALPVALVYALLPNYSTDRLWFIAIAITFSMTACLASVYADLRAVVARGWMMAGWKVVAGVALIASALSYEVALPILLITPLLMAWHALRSAGRPLRRRLLSLLLLVAVNLVLLAGAAAFKLRTTVRLGADHGIVAQVTTIARDALRWDAPAEAYGLNVFSAVRVHFGDYGVRLPAIAAAAMGRAPVAVLWLALVVALGSFAYLMRTAGNHPWPPLREWGLVTCAGLVVFGLGYAIFLTNYNVQFTPTGIANRSAIAAALGAAICLVGVIGGVTSVLRSTRIAAAVFALAIACVAGSSVLIVNVIAADWAAAYEKEQDVLAGIRRNLPVLPPGSIVILDGVCPYIGPAIVFESNWDLAGALQTFYREVSLKADVVTPRLAVGDSWVSTTIYGERTTYPYGPHLLVYDARSGASHALTDAATARAYFAASSTASACPPGHEGIGVSIF